MGEDNGSFIPRPIYKRPVLSEDQMATGEAWKALQARGIPEGILRAFQITGSRYRDKEGRIVDAIVFPHFVDGELISVQYRRVAEKIIRNASDTEMVVYNHDNIEDDLLVWVEGHLDVLSVAVTGITSVVTLQTGGVQPGSKDNSIRLEPLDKAVDRLSSVKRVVLFCDNDEPGFLLEAELIRRLGAKRCWRVSCPEDCKDANDVLMKYGPEKLRELIDEAKPVPIAGIITGADIWRDIDALHYEGIKPGAHPGWDNLAELYRVPPGQWTLITGTPGSGKSGFMDHLDVNLNASEGWRMGYYTPEMHPIARHAAQLMQQAANKPFKHFSKAELDNYKYWIAENFFWIKPIQDRSLPRILDYMETLVARYGIKKVRLDPWNRFEHIKADNQDGLDYLARSLDLISVFAQDMSVHVDLIAHPTKMRYDYDGRIQVPGPYDVSGGAHFFNMADFILVIDRDTRTPGGEVDAYVCKVRMQEHGRTGRVTFSFDLATCRYYGVPTREVRRNRRRQEDD